MKVLIVGGNGFVGRHLAAAFAIKGATVVSASRSGNNVPESDKARQSFTAVDVRDYSSVRDLLGRVEPSLVINLAATTSGSFEQMVTTNVGGAVNLLRAIHATVPSAGFISFGSAAEYGNVAADRMPITESQEGAPVGPYGYSKLAATSLGMQLANSLGIRTWVIRPFNIVGAGSPESLFVGALIRRVKSALKASASPVVSVGRLDTYRDFISVIDVANAVVEVGLQEIEPGIYNICTGQPILLENLLLTIRRLSGTEFDWKTDPSLYRETDPLLSYGSNDKLRRAIGLKLTVSLEEALQSAWRAAMAQN